MKFQALNQNKVIIPLVLVGLVIVLFTVEYFWAKHQVDLKFKAAKQVVAQVLSRQLVRNNNGICILPRQYAGVTVNGKIYVTETKDSLTIVFPLRTGMKANFDGIIYSNKQEHDVFGGHQRSLELHSIDGVPGLDGTVYDVVVDRKIESMWYEVHRDSD